MRRAGLIALGAAVALGVAAPSLASAHGHAATKPIATHRSAARPGAALGTPASRYPATRQVKATPPTTVTLPTGERLRVDGAKATPTKATTSPFITFVSDGDVYAIPAAAVKYVGSVLDPRLFDVSYLARTGNHVAADVTVDGKGAPLPAGRITLTRAHIGTLGAKIEAHKLRGIEHVELVQVTGHPPLPTAPAAGPSGYGGKASAATGDALPFETLTIKTVDRTGASADAYIFVQNVDDASLAAFSTPSEGSSTFSLPRGTYSVEAAIVTPDGPGVAPNLPAFTTSLVTDPEFTLGHHTTITLDARSAIAYHPTLDPAIAQPGYREDSISPRPDQRHGRHDRPLQRRVGERLAQPASWRSGRSAVCRAEQRGA